MSERLKVPLAPMEALHVAEIPTGSQWQYEPKWDGFRCLAFRRGNNIQLQSKSGQLLTRYFPEVVGQLLALKAKQFVLDGEIVIANRGRLSFNDLLMRIHPAKSRVEKLARETPAFLIVFDLLEDENTGSLIKLPLQSRRLRLEAFAKRQFSKAPRIALSPVTLDVKQARRWFGTAGGNLDGIVAKRRDLEYRSGDRTGMVKIKPVRTADCVVGGFRYATGKRLVGSLLLGLYNDAGFTASLKRTELRDLTKKLVALIQPPGFTGKAPGGPSRWSTKRSTEWQPLKTKLVVEVECDHFTGGRFRHGTKLVRWRPDKAPQQCRIDQIAVGGQGALELVTRLKSRAH